MPATSEPASGSVMPRQRIFSPLIAGTTHSCFCSSVPKARIGGIAMSVWTATPMARPPRLRVDHLLGEHERRVVVAALAAVLLGLVEAEEARARPCAWKTESGNVVSSHSSACGASSLVAKLRIDSRSCSCSSVKMKCLRVAPKSGLRTVSVAAMKVDSRTSHFLRQALERHGGREHGLHRPTTQEDHMAEGDIDKGKGRIKEAAGDLTGDKSLRTRARPTAPAAASRTPSTASPTSSRARTSAPAA